MNKLEQEFNKNRKGFPVIECYILDMVNGGGFGASLNAFSISDVVKNLPDGYELELLGTLENYFEHKKIDEYAIALKNSQYIYYEDFEKIIDRGFYEYINSLDSRNQDKADKMDREFMHTL